MNEIVSIYRRAHFNAAHRLFVSQWSDEENSEFFGKCSNPYYHGHNYELEVRLTGAIDPVTGFLFDMTRLKDLIKIHVEDRFDHKNLNVECAEFKHRNPTAENICVVIYNILREYIPEDIKLRVKLWETPRNYVSYPVD
ncbi:MAG TPA: 6-carboxytetrahydropterin synthase [Saprospiraceae bacterium]|nr:6-carboxytetrahydropterin synthase [Saprospiraceae bacterium]